MIRFSNSSKNSAQSTEEQARMSAAKFKSAAFDTVSFAMMTIDRNFNITYMNKGVIKLFQDNIDTFRAVWPNFDPERLIGQSIDSFHKNPAHQRKILSNPANMPYRANIVLGKMRIALNVNGIFDESGEYAGNVLEWIDISAVTAFKALESNQAMITFTPDGKIVSCNRAFSDAMGYEEQEILGKHHSIFVEPVYAGSPEYRNFWEQLRRGEAFAAVLPRVTKRGSKVYLLGSYNPILDETGKVTGVVKVATDITASENERLEAVERNAAMSARQAKLVDSLRNSLEKLADGDLTVSLISDASDEYDQLRSDFNRAVGELRATVSAVISNAAGIQNDATEISRAADDLSRRTENQAATLEQTSAALEELTASVRSAAEGTEKANNSASEAKRNAEESGVVVKDTVVAMSEIEESSRQISQIIGVIDDIAFQTNLLALNAGVEAARAGDAGRGFAVVASEVRALAQRSSDASKQIKQLISKSSQQVDRGVNLVNETGRSLKEIVSSVTDIATLVADIAATAKEQATGISEINSAVSQLDQVTQQNAAMVEESTAASHSMREEANSLSNMVSRFKIGEGSVSTASAAPIVSPALRSTTSVAKSVQGAPARGGAQPAAKDDVWEDF
jgi:methyl-accepting chemotaxis protein